ncbi:hypothetical protein D3C81_1070330 [compost metagenome]
MADTDEFGTVACGYSGTPNDITRAVMAKACGQGYTGTYEARMEELGWRVAPVFLLPAAGASLAANWPADRDPIGTIIEHTDAGPTVSKMETTTPAAAPGIDLERIVPPQWWSDQVGGIFDDLSSGQAWRMGFNECRTRVLLLIEQARELAQIDASPKGGSDVVRGVTVERLEDMSARGRLKLYAQEDGDMCLMVVENNGTSAGIEFCASGGRSPRTLEAVRALSRAMEQDNADHPINRATSGKVDP